MADTGHLVASGFQYSYRNDYFDWRLLHGIDVDALIRLTDTKAVERVLTTLQHGSITAERNLSSANCIQLFRLLQLAIEHTTHMHNGQSTLLEYYHRTINAAERYKAAAETFMQTGTSFIAECVAGGSFHVQLLGSTDDANAQYRAMDGLYNSAMDALEQEDARLRAFHFRKHRAELNWQLIYSVDVDRMVSTASTAPLEGPLMHTLTYGSIIVEDESQMTAHHFAQLIPLAQCALDLAVFKANTTGRAMEQAIQQLHASCANVPALTTAITDLDAQLKGFITEAHRLSVKEVAQGGGGSLTSAGRRPSARPSNLRSSQQAAPGSFQQQQPLAPPSPAYADNSGLPWDASGPQRPMTGGRGVQYSGPQYGGQHSRLGSPALRAAQPHGMQSSPPFAPPAPSAYGPPVYLTSRGAPLQYEERGVYLTQSGQVPLELRSHATDIHHQVDTLEQDLRVERLKTDEMKRLVEGMREQLLRPAGGDYGAGSVFNNSFGVPGGAGLGAMPPPYSLPFPTAVGASSTSFSWAGGGPASRAGGGAPPPPPLSAATSWGQKSLERQLSLEQAQLMNPALVQAMVGAATAALAAAGVGGSGGATAVSRTGSFTKRQTPPRERRNSRLGGPPRAPSPPPPTGGMRAPSPARMSPQQPLSPATKPTSPVDPSPPRDRPSPTTVVRVQVDEGLIRAEERTRTVNSFNERLRQQVSSLKEQALKLHTASRSGGLTSGTSNVSLASSAGQGGGGGGGLPPAPRRPPERPSTAAPGPLTSGLSRYSNSGDDVSLKRVGRSEAPRRPRQPMVDGS